MHDLAKLADAVIIGAWKETPALTKELCAAGAKPEDIIINSLQYGMTVVGEKYSTGEYFLPDMLKAARAMNSSLVILKPLLEDASVTKLGTIVIGTVKADMHDIGKNIVTSFLRGVGFEVFDIGVDVSEDKFVEAVREHKPQILGLSALLTTTMYEIGTVIKKLESTGLRSTVKVVAGGAPVTERFAREMGADCYAKDGGAAVKICKELVGR